jgi:hypothetical protein
VSRRAAPQVLFRDHVGGQHALDAKIVDREVDRAPDRGARVTAHGPIDDAVELTIAHGSVKPCTAPSCRVIFQQVASVVTSSARCWVNAMPAALPWTYISRKRFSLLAGN